MEIKNNIQKNGTITLTIDRQEAIEIWYSLRAKSGEYASRLTHHPDDEITIKAKELCNEIDSMIASVLFKRDGNGDYIWKNSKCEQRMLLLEDEKC